MFYVNLKLEFRPQSCVTEAKKKKKITLNAMILVIQKKIDIFKYSPTTGRWLKMTGVQL